MTLTEYPDTELLALGLADTLSSELRMVLGHKERALFVVPGGTTPGPIFDALCDADLDWGRVDILLSDERWRPEVHVRSNTRLIRARLLTGRAAAARFLPLYVRSDSPEAVLPELESNISPVLPIDICLLGMGTDMHTASLIPGAEGLEAALDDRAPILVPIRAKGEDEARVTLSACVLAGAICTHIVITGARKREALERARHLRPIEAPVAAILGNATVHWAPEE
ncbi:6-phosphogluconolactonase [Roseovarius autotrophicus]|uniref:6-phosphogluconolactonase n=1 Tax=Roseovarius autotrophicus TaxID=2824121 RepID=UPI0019FA432C|nr:6-phosphogluconolactonase [Roseovarius autotrophicus]MBE0454664.1 6-phosphogluconolactonase [Roseovarius sp.]